MTHFRREFAATVRASVRRHPLLAALVLLGVVLAIPTCTAYAAGTLGSRGPAAAVTREGVTSAPAPAGDGRLMLTPQQWATDQQGPTMDAMFPSNGFAMHHPLLVWWIALEVLGILAFPFTFVFLSNLVDRGFVVAKTIGLLLVGYIVWISVSLGAATYDRGLIWLVVALLAVGGAGLAFLQRDELSAFFRAKWGPVLAGEAVFLAGFAIFVLLRMWYPDLGHQFAPVSPTDLGSGRMGEKQMEMAFLNAIVRSRVFPPYDPLFAHGFINYYYYGFLLVGTLCKLTQIIPSTGFNLAIATFFAMLVGNTFSVVLSLTRRIVPGVLAAAFVGIIGNLNGGWQLIRDLMGVATVHSSLPIVGGIVDIVSGLEQVIFARQPLPPFDFWESTRIIPPPGVPISEFPYFTYLFADLHPHLMAYPMTLAMLALAVNLLLGPAGRGWRLGVTVVLGGVLAGAIVATNPWDFPTYVGVVGLGALVGAYAARRRVELRLLVRPVAWAVGLGALSLFLYLPFIWNYHTVFATGIGLARNIPPQTFCSQGVTSCPDQARDAIVTPLRIYLEHFGLFVFLAVSYLVVLLTITAGGLRRWRRWRTRAQFAWYYRDRLAKVRRAAPAARRLRRPQEQVVDGTLAAGLFILVAGLLVFQYTLLALLVLMLGLVGLLLLRLGKRLPKTQIFLLVLLCVPVALSLLTQVFYIKDFLDGSSAFRMNTIFKFYNQAWVLYAVVAASALYYIVHALLPRGQRRMEEREAAVALDGHAVTADGATLAHQVPTSVQDQALASVAAERGRSADPWGGATADVPAGVSADEPPAGANVPTSRPGPRPRPTWRALWSLAERHWLWTSALILLLAGSLVYTYAGTVARETYRQAWLPENSVPFTLDGMAFMKVAYPSDYAGITWLNGHVAGAQVIAEAPSFSYDWSGRVAMFTGLPDIQSGIHESEQRWGDELNRTGDINALYSTTDPNTAWRIIHTYGVRYIYVGWVETHCLQEYGQTAICYPKSGIDKFQQMVGHGLRVAFHTNGTTIYEVTA